MSLISREEEGSWDIVLRDSSGGAMVLHNNVSNELSVVHSTRLRQQLPIAYQQLPTRNSLTDGISICSTCGQPIPAENVKGREPGGSDEDVAASNLRSGMSRSIQRDINYFKLLGATPLESGPFISVEGISTDAFSQGYFQKFFITKAMLGRGSNGFVYLVEHVLDGVSLGFFALKKVAIGDNRQWLQKALAEVNLLRMLSHRNLVGYNHVWLENSSLSAFGPSVPCAFILEEYCNGGTLEDYVNKTGVWTLKDHPESKREKLRRRSRGSNGARPSVKLSNMEIVSFMSDIVKGVAHLHSHHIIHRDLKPSNCLLISNLEDNTGLPMVLVSDFGEGQMEGILRSGTGSTGTLEYCAPELVNRVDGKLAQFSYKTDIFSLGMILFYLCHSRLPYRHAGGGEESESIELLAQEVSHFNGLYLKTTDIRSDIDYGLYQLLNKMLSLNARERPTAEETLSALSEIELRMDAGQGILHPGESTATGNNTKLLTMGEDILEAEIKQYPFGFELVQRVSSHFMAIKFILVAVKMAGIYSYNGSRLAQVLILLLGIELPMWENLASDSVLFCPSLSRNNSIQHSGMAVDMANSKNLNGTQDGELR